MRTSETICIAGLTSPLNKSISLGTTQTCSRVYWHSAAKTAAITLKTADTLILDLISPTGHVTAGSSGNCTLCGRPTERRASLTGKCVEIGRIAECRGEGGRALLGHRLAAVLSQVQVIQVACINTRSDSVGIIADVFSLRTTLLATAIECALTVNANFVDIVEIGGRVATYLIANYCENIS